MQRIMWDRIKKSLLIFLLVIRIQLPGRGGGKNQLLLIFTSGMQVVKNSFQQSTENISTTPFGFCTYTSRYRYTCTHVLCQNEDYSPSLLGTILTVPIPQKGNVYSQFDMKEAVMSILEDSECEKIYQQCHNPGANQKLEIIDTREFLILQLVLFDPVGQK